MMFTMIIIKNDETDILQEGYRKIMNHYAADMLDELCSTNDGSAVTRYADSNMEYLVYYSYNYYLRLGGISADTYGMMFRTEDAMYQEMEYMFWLKEGYTFYGNTPDNLYNIMTGELVSDKIAGSQMSDRHGKYFSIACKISDDIKKGDAIYDWNKFITGIYDFKVPIIIGAYVSGLMFLISLVLLVVVCGNKYGKKGVRLWMMDKIPFEIVTAIVLLTEILLGMGIHLALYEGTPLIVVLAMMIAMASVLLLYVLSIARRIKAGKMYRYTVLYYVSGPLDGVWNDISKNIPLLLKVVLALTILTLLELFAIVKTDDEKGILILLFVLYKLFEYTFVIYVTFQMWILKRGFKKIVAGDLEQKIDTEKLRGEFKQFGENINKVSDGIAVAVEKQIKSEHMKTELLTNVSHDIKTPLTSIINYVDLLKKEKLEDETVVEYIDVLDRQSLRLKKLIEDLMEASKASTGNVDVNLEVCDVKVVLSQALGEYEEKIKKASIEMVVSKPDEETLALVDGRHLWRVTDNLINNVCKYAMEGTRAYLDIKNIDTGVQITVKNISKEPLNISSEELMERFVRGDSSRNTEGSGLGLSIAKSLTELMGGTMELVIDGDLFKVILEFLK